MAVRSLVMPATTTVMALTFLTEPTLSFMAAQFEFCACRLLVVHLMTFI